MTLAGLAAVVGGEVAPEHRDLAVTGAAFLDSRDPVPGGLFAAFAGEHADGHEHAAAAVTGGAVAVLGSRRTDAPTVVVPDVRHALQTLAGHVLAELRRTSPGLRVVAITGSQGKTTTKDLLARVLGDHGPTIATHGSFNNELGLPLTVLRADAGTRYLVLEMGARGIGHLAALCAIARPDVSVVLNVGTAHLGEFGTRENIALAKGELVEALTDEGVAVLNRDDPLVRAMTRRTRGRVLTFGRDPAADVRLVDVDLDHLGRARFGLVAGTEQASVQLQVLGRHQADNAAAVAAAAVAVGIGLDEAATGLAGVTALSPWRMEVHERRDGLVVVNDAYNANPESMRAALETLAELGRRSGRRTVAVLGEMRELGEAAEDAYAGLGRLLDSLEIDEAVVIGPEAAPIRGRATRHVGAVEDAVGWLRHNVRGTDVVLVKASRGARLERVADALLGSDPTEEVPG